MQTLAGIPPIISREPLYGISLLPPNISFLKLIAPQFPGTSVISSPISIPKGFVISFAPYSFKITRYSSSSTNNNKLPPFL